MTKKTRLIILLICVISFLVITPNLVLYSMGYRLDIRAMKITATGGIYVRTLPAAENIAIDSNSSQRPGMFTNSIFVQNLFPGEHTVLVQKNGYFDYTKTIPVQKSQVTKLENVLLFKKDIKIEQAKTETQSPFEPEAEKFLIKNSNLHYSDIPENADLLPADKKNPIVRGLAAFTERDNTIIWLSTDGFLYEANIDDLPLPTNTPTPSGFLQPTLENQRERKLIAIPLKISSKGAYEIIIAGQNLLLDNNGQLLLLNTKTNDFQIIADSAKNIAISPDGRNIVYSNNKTVYFYALSEDEENKAIIYESEKEIGSCVWLNNNYIIFASGDKIFISETDYRGKANTITLPQKAVLSDSETINIEKPEIFFNSQEGKLYILSEEILFVSEKIIP